MRIYDIICNKRDGKELTKEEINYMIESYCKGKIEDYQMSAMLMAIYLNGMTDEETANLTEAMTKSGDIVDLSYIEGIKVDKHSTGGVGDKTTLIIAPIVACYGVKVAKMSGRGLGHTGGTIDKLEAIPNFKTNLDKEEFFNVINEVGFSIVAQSGNLAPADKKIYALRDVTGTVESIPLIASSIMSKKLASGSDCILLDVKVGSGAFMKDIDSSIELAKKMVAIGEHCGKKTVALITDMDIPLGKNIGNALEIKEVVEVLKGKGPQDLTNICITLSSNILYIAGKGTLEECEKMSKEALKNGLAFEKFVQMVERQGGDTEYIKNTEKFGESKYKEDIFAQEDGYIYSMDTEEIGIASVILGAGREKKDDKIDYLAGIILDKKTGDKVNRGDKLCTIYSGDKNKLDLAKDKIIKAISIQENKSKKTNLIKASVFIDKIVKF